MILGFRNVSRWIREAILVLEYMSVYNLIFMIIFYGFPWASVNSSFPSTWREVLVK